MLKKYRLFVCVTLFTLAGVALLGCSGSKEGTAPAAESQKSSSTPASGKIQPCKLLTAAQVATVLPDHDDGMVALAGGSLMKGVDAYQCSYSNKDMNILTVVLNVAENEERFSWIKPSEGSHRDDRKIEIGDAGWAYGDADDLKVRVVKGLTVIDLELMAPGAQGKSAAMIELARVIVQGLQ